MSDAAGAAPRREPLPLADGCYLIRFTPTAPSAHSDGRSYEGTLRFETKTGRPIASGDLYQRVFDANAGTFGPPPDPKAGIPIFPIASWRYYLRVTDVLPAEGGFCIAFEPMQFFKGPDPVTFLNGNQTNWLAEAGLTARMGPMPEPVPPDDPALVPDDFPPPAAFPFPELCFAGEVLNHAGVSIGTMQMGLVSRHLRKATVEIDRVAGVPVPQDSGTKETWNTLFETVGWDLTLSISDSDVAEPPGQMFNPGQAHDAMRARREKTDLNREWHYHVLAVRRIKLAHSLAIGLSPEEQEQETQNGERGHMYDVGGDVPREGLMVASDYLFPDKDMWGLVRGKRLGTTAEYLRTAVHELGHAMGLQHNDIDNGFMSPSDAIAQKAGNTPDTVFPHNVVWAFAPDDAHRLRHWPDLIVRPGGAIAPSRDNAPVSAFASDRLRLDVEPPSPTVPLGAPVRIRLTLTNIFDKPVLAPDNISLESGFVRGRVIGPSGKARTFSSLVVNDIHGDFPSLLPGKPVEDWLTLFEGAGELFPAPGIYLVVVEVAWRGPINAVNGAKEMVRIDVVVVGQAQVTVT